MISFHNVTARVGSFVLDIEDCLLERGGIYAVVGPNGCGKTTFMNLASFMLRPEGGEVIFDDGPIDYGDAEMLLAHRRRVAYLMQDPYLFNTSVRKNVEYGLRLRGIPYGEMRKRTDAILEKLTLTEMAEKEAHQISGGEAQRVALARALVLHADVLLLDEPTANVDHGNVREIEKLVLEISRERGTTVLFSTHLREQAHRMCEKTVSIIDGRIRDIAYENVFSGSLEQESDGVRTVRVADSLQLQVAEGEPGAVSVAVDPKDIIISTTELESSALNRFRGEICRIGEAGSSLRVFVDVGVELCALITRKSFDDLALNIGKAVWATFKANAVKVICGARRQGKDGAHD